MAATLREVHVAILAAVTAEFGSTLETVASYSPDISNPINTPALLLELEGFGDGQDRGEDRIPLRCRFTAHCILSLETPDVEIEVAQFAAQLHGLIAKNRWGLGADLLPPENIESAPSTFKPGKHGYESWAVTWEQTVYLGESKWASTIMGPLEVNVALSPDVGVANIDGYERL